MQNHISRWILIPSYLFSLLGLFFSYSLYFLPPQTFIPTIDAHATGISYLAQMAAARQLGVTSIIGYAAFKKSIPMLTISLVIFLIIQVQDVIIGILHRDMGLMGGALVVGTISAFMLFNLKKQQKM